MEEIKKEELTLCWECCEERWNYQDPSVELREGLGGHVFCERCGEEIL